MTGLQASIRRIPRVVWPILVVAFVVRLLVAAETHIQLNHNQDSWDYHRHAKSIARGDGYPRSSHADSDRSAFRAPLYPYFLGAVYAITGGEAKTARFVQAALGTVTVALIGLLAWQLAGTAVALASLGIAAIYPQFVSIDTALLTEALFVPIELAAPLVPPAGGPGVRVAIRTARHRGAGARRQVARGCPSPHPGPPGLPGGGGVPQCGPSAAPVWPRPDER